MTQKRSLRQSLRSAFPFAAVFVRSLGLVYSKRSMLRELGWVESVRTRKPCRRDGSPLPWMNYHVIGFLEQRLTQDLSMFEYGSGNSTMFYASKVGYVKSIETDEGWYSYVRDTMPENVDLELFTRTDGSVNYCEISGQQDRKYDIVVVDAEERTECLMHADKAVSERGVILLDDATPEVHGPGMEHLTSRGFRRLDFEGLKPASIRAYRTSIFYRDGNCLGI
jgi:hypothetical protein